MTPAHRTLRKARGTFGQLPTDLNVLSYARISADTEGDAHGVLGQHQDHDQYAAMRGWTVVRRFTDNDKSASKKGVRRGDFETMIEVLEAGELPDGTPIHGAIIERFDRASRTFGDWERFHDALISQPDRVLVIDGNDKDPYSDGFLWESAAAMVGAKSEPKKISARTRISHRRRAVAGTPVGGNRPFGWMPDRVTLDPAEAPYVQKAIDDYIAGKRVGAIVRDFWEAGVTTSLGNKWTSDSLKKMISNPRMCGLRKLDGEIVKDPKTGEDVIGNWTPIVSREQWEAVIARMEAASLPEDQKGRSNTKLLTGFLRCGKINPATGLPCLTKLRVVEVKGSKGHAYNCPPPYNGGCAGIGRNGPRTDAYIAEMILQRLDEQNWAKHESSTGFPKQTLLEEALGRRGALAVAWSDKAISNDLFFQQVAVIEKEIASLENERRAHLALVARQQSVPANAREEWRLREARGDLGYLRAIVGRSISAIIVKSVPKGTKKLKAEHYEIIWRED